MCPRRSAALLACTWRAHSAPRYSTSSCICNLSAPLHSAIASALHLRTSHIRSAPLHTPHPHPHLISPLPHLCSVAEVSAEYARMLETRCDYDAALQHYDGALASEMAKDAEDRDARLVERCVAGRVRALLQARTGAGGEVARGALAVTLATLSDSVTPEALQHHGTTLCPRLFMAAGSVSATDGSRRR